MYIGVKFESDHFIKYTILRKGSIVKIRAPSAPPPQDISRDDTLLHTHKMGLWSRTYVCCAVPLCKRESLQPTCVLFRRVFADCGRALSYNVDNSGIYAIMSQFAIIALVTGILCFAAPSSESHACCVLSTLTECGLGVGTQSSLYRSLPSVHTSSAQSVS